MTYTLSSVLVLVLILSVCHGKITDEEYALMPPVFHVDDYDHCMLLKEPLYCYIEFQLEPIDSLNTSKTWQVIDEYSSSPLHYRHDLLRHTICVQQICPHMSTFESFSSSFKKELSKCYSQKYENDGLKGSVTTVKCRTSKPLFEIENTDILFAAIVIGYVIFVILISMYDLKEYYLSPESYKQFELTSLGRFVKKFSIPSNWDKLRQLPTGGDFEKLKSVQGIRVLMTVMIIGVHTCLTFTVLPLSNPKWIEESNENPDLLTEVPKRGIFLLSFHFMTSSWILMNSILGKTDRNEEITLGFIVKSVIKRYVRFFPTLALTVGIYATWFRHVPMGPFWSGVCTESDRCRQNGWLNLLFIQNHVNRYWMCHIVSWYLAVEMQYYIIMLFLMKIMMKYRKTIPLQLFCLIVLNAILVYFKHYGYPSTLNALPEEIYMVKFNQKSQWHDHFASFYGNFAGTLIGMLFGYYFYENKNKRLFKNKVSISLWWTVSFGLIGLVFSIPFIIEVDTTPMSSAIWVAATRPICSVGMGLLVFGLSHGLGGCVKWMCDWTPYQYLAKLSYTVYISHTIIQGIRVAILRHPVHVNPFMFLSTVASDVLLSFLVAVPLTLLFEMPANELANSLFSTKTSKESRPVREKKE